jgi:hypothetical protein
LGLRERADCRVQGSPSAILLANRLEQPRAGVQVRRGNLALDAIERLPVEQPRRGNVALGSPDSLVALDLGGGGVGVEHARRPEQCHCAVRLLQ